MKSTRNRFGRPPIITPEVVEAIGKNIALGLTEEMACTLADVNPQTFGPAVCRNPELKEILKIAQARFQLAALRTIAAGGEIIELRDSEGRIRKVARPWQGLAWILERRHKAQFS